MSAICALEAGALHGGMPTHTTVAPPLAAMCMNCAARWAYRMFHSGDVYGTSGGPEEVLGVVGAHHDDDDLRIGRLEVRLQLCRPVEVVRRVRPGALSGVERGVHDTGGGEVVLESPAHVEAERVPHDQHPQRVGGGGRSGVADRRRGRASPGSGHRSAAGDRRPGGRGPSDPDGQAVGPARQACPPPVAETMCDSPSARLSAATGPTMSRPRCAACPRARPARCAAVSERTGGTRRECADAERQHARPRRPDPAVGRRASSGSARRHSARLPDVVGGVRRRSSEAVVDEGGHADRAVGGDGEQGERRDPDLHRGALARERRLQPGHAQLGHELRGDGADDDETSSGVTSGEASPAVEDPAETAKAWDMPVALKNTQPRQTNWKVRNRCTQTRTGPSATAGRPRRTRLGGARGPTL